MRVVRSIGVGLLRRFPRMASTAVVFLAYKELYKTCGSKRNLLRNLFKIQRLMAPVMSSPTREGLKALIPGDISELVTPPSVLLRHNTGSESTPIVEVPKT